MCGSIVKLSDGSLLLALMVILLIITITFGFTLCKTLLVVNVHDLELRFLVMIIVCLSKLLWDGCND